MPFHALHHSRFLRFRSPFGAVPAGEAVTLRLWVSARYANASVTLRMWVGDRERLLPMQGTPGDGGV